MSILCYIWLKITKANDMPTSVVGCYIPHQDFDFFGCLDKHQMFVNLDYHVTYFKHKGEIIVFGHVNAPTISLQLDAQQSFLPYVGFLCTRHRELNESIELCLHNNIIGEKI